MAPGEVRPGTGFIEQLRLHQSPRRRVLSQESHKGSLSVSLHRQSHKGFERLTASPPHPGACNNSVTNGYIGTFLWIEPEVSYSHPQTQKCHRWTLTVFSCPLSQKTFKGGWQTHSSGAPAFHAHILKSQWGLTKRQLTGTLQSADVIHGKLQVQPAVEFCDRSTPGTASRHSKVTMSNLHKAPPRK